jgi:hypothetical protein
MALFLELAPFFGNRLIFFKLAHTNNVVLKKPFSNPNNSNLDFLLGLGIGGNDPVMIP